MKFFLLSSLSLSLAVLLTSLGLFSAFATASGTQIHFLDIGQGDATLVRTTQGRVILIDTGPSPQTLEQELSAVLPPLHKRIDLLILTHSDWDHISGGTYLLEEYEVGTLLINDELPVTEEMQQILDHATLLGTSVQHVQAMQDLIIEPGVLIDFLTPVTAFHASSPNDHSVVFMLVLPHDRILFTGDAESDAEHALLQSGSGLQATWYKGGHHGSATSSTKRFLEAVNPQGVIFQNGRGNSYGHPAEEVLDRLDSAQIPVYNTSTDGRLQLSCLPEVPCTMIPPS